MCYPVATDVPKKDFMGGIVSFLVGLSFSGKVAVVSHEAEGEQCPQSSLLC